MKRAVIVNISLYNFNSIPVRLFHSWLLEQGAVPHSIFFKNLENINRENTAHRPVQPGEYDLLYRTIGEIGPDVVTLSVMAPYAPMAREIVREVKRVAGVPVIVGGKYPTAYPERALSFADYACRGEGELVLREVAARAAAGDDFRGITGLWHRSDSGDVVEMGMQEPLRDLDTLPWQAVGLENMSYIERGRVSTDDPELDETRLWIMASRGCCFHCAFCINGLLHPLVKGQGPVVRQRSPEDVIGEIEQRISRSRAGAEYLIFIDEDFGVSPRWTERFCELYRQRIAIPFYCEMHPRLIKEQNVERLSAVGLHELKFGIQSCSEEIRNGLMNRPGSNEEILDRITILRRHDVKVCFDLIIENAFETVETLEQGVRFLLRIEHPYKCQFFKLQYFPEYPMTLKALEAGLISEDDLSEERIAGEIFNDWFYRPGLWDSDRKAVLQNCMFILAWNTVFGRSLSRRFLAGGRRFCGLSVNLMAVLQYFWTVRLASGFLGPLLRGLRHLLRGEVGILAGKIHRKVGPQ